MPTAPRRRAGAAGRAMVALSTAAAAAVVGLGHAPAPAAPLTRPTTTTTRAIPAHFVGLSLEWSLVERYMGPRARPTFANLLRNLGSGVLRVGGSSQDLLPFASAARDSNRVVTPADLAAVRRTLDLAGGAPRWAAILGAGMSPRTSGRAAAAVRRFVTRGVEPAFRGAARREVAGIELGNEVDVSYRDRVRPYLRDFAAASRATGPFAIVGPSTSEVIAPARRLRRHAGEERFFWKWPALLATIAPRLRASASPLGAFASDHFYPTARSCAGAPYRCASVARLLSDERRDNLRFQVATHARAAARRGLGYRLAETNSCANRGVRGVSDVAASALWALDAMFTAADAGAVGVNFHGAEVRAFSHPGEGNAAYNPVRYDPSPAMGAPTVAPEYYALLLFARFAQGTRGLRAVATPGARSVSAWRVEADGTRGRVFLVNKGSRRARVSVPAPAATYAVDRMTPADPSGRGRTLTAPAVRIDGRAVAADGRWPGFAPTAGRSAGGRADVALGGGEAAVVSFGE